MLIGDPNPSTPRRTGRHPELFVRSRPRDAISDTDPPADDDEPSEHRIQRLSDGLTRRRLLLGIGGVVGVLAAGGLAVSRALDGDFGGYTAPDDQPTLSVRGPPDDTASRAVSREGDWSFDSGELFVFVHGFDTDATAARDQAYTAEVALDELRPAPVAAYSWESALDWDDAKRTADAAADPLADWLVEWADEDGRPVHLLGYSLGARVCLEALDRLVDEERSAVVASISLLGGAVPHDSVARGGRYGSTIADAKPAVVNFHSRNDRVLGWVYRLSDRTRAVGHGGISDADGTPAGYRDVDVTDHVADHYSYFQPDEGCLPEVVDALAE